MIRIRMKQAQDRQKSWADIRRKDIEFQVGDHVFLKVSPTRGVVRFTKRGKLIPRYVGPFEILERIDKLAYRLALPPRLSGVHNVFHVSQLRRYVFDSDHVIPMDELDIREDLTFDEQPAEIIDRKDQVLRRRSIPYVKVRWPNQTEREALWMLEEKARSKYPILFENQG